MKYIRGALSGHEQLYEPQVDPEERFSWSFKTRRTLKRAASS